MKVEKIRRSFVSRNCFWLPQPGIGRRSWQTPMSATLAVALFLPSVSPAETQMNDIPGNNSFCWTTWRQSQGRWEWFCHRRWHQLGDRGLGSTPLPWATHCCRSLGHPCQQRGSQLFCRANAGPRLTQFQPPHGHFRTTLNTLPHCKGCRAHW